MERTINVNDASFTDAELAEGELSTADLNNAVGGYWVTDGIKAYNKAKTMVEAAIIILGLHD